VLRIGMAAEAESLDPPNFRISSDLIRADLIFDGLVDAAADGTIVPALATEWAPVDETTWEFKLREGVTFHDGESLDAAAVETSLERAAAADQGSAYLGVLEDVEVVDDLTVRLHLERPYAAILNNLTVPVAGIQSPAALAEHGDDVSRHPVGTGPFQFVEWQLDTKLVLAANPDYWGGAPALDRVEFIPIPEASTRLSALRTGSLEVIENPSPDEIPGLGSSGLAAVVEPKARPIFLGFNVEEIPDVRVRTAIAMALDKEAIVDAVLEGLGTPATESLVTPEFRGEAAAVGIAYDPDGAKALLEEAGATGLSLRVVLPTERYLRDTAVMEVIQAQLAEVGITLELDIRDSGAWYQALLDRDTELYWLGWGLNSYDPGDLFTRVFATGAVNNMSQLAAPDVDALVGELESAAVGSEERAAIVSELERLVVEEHVAVVPIYHSKNLFAVAADVEGFHTTPGEMLDLSATTVG